MLLCDHYHYSAQTTGVTWQYHSFEKEKLMNAVKSLKADWAIIAVMIIVAVVMYGYLIPKYW